MFDKDSEFQKKILDNLGKKDIILKVGKSHVKERGKIQFDRNKKSTWDDSPVRDRWSLYKRKDANMGYMAMFPIILITDDDIPKSLRDYCKAKDRNCENIVFDVEYAIARRGGLANYPLDNDTSERHGREAVGKLGGAILYVVYRHKEVGPLRDDHVEILEKQEKLEVSVKSIGDQQNKNHEATTEVLNKILEKLEPETASRSQTNEDKLPEVATV